MNKRELKFRDCNKKPIYEGDRVNCLSIKDQQASEHTCVRSSF